MMPWGVILSRANALTVGRLAASVARGAKSQQRKMAQDKLWNLYEDAVAEDIYMKLEMEKLKRDLQRWRYE